MKAKYINEISYRYIIPYAYIYIVYIYIYVYLSTYARMCLDSTAKMGSLMLRLIIVK